MTVKELNKDQREELKCDYYCNVLHAGKGVSYGELADIDNLVSDQEIDEYYKNTEFVEGDFWCSTGEEDL